MPVQHLDEVIGYLPAAVEALVDHRALLVGLRKVVAVEVGESASARVGQIDVGQLAVGELVDLLLVALDPVDVAQRRLAGHGSDGNVVRILAVGRADAQADHLARRAFEQLLNIHAGGEVLAFDGEDAVAHRDVQPRLRQRRLLVRIEQRRRYRSSSGNSDCP